MPIQTRNITVVLSNPDGSPIEGALLRVRLVQTDSDAGGLVAPSLLEFTTDEDGEAVMELFENNPGASNSYYQIYCQHPVTGVPIFNGDQFQVPSSNAQLKDIITLNLLTPVEPTSEAVAQVAADKIAAANSAAAAATSATNAATSATNSANSATASEGHADDAEAAKDAATTSQTAAAASATTASTAAGVATTKAGEAEDSATAAAASATTASGHSTTASGYAGDAETAASVAEGHAATATTKATLATTKAGEAAASAITAGNSATTATTKAGEASASAASALTHKNDAETAKTAAQNSATAASNSETAAGNSETAAAASENNAGDAAVSAAADRVLAQTAAGIAQSSATAAENSEINAANHEEQAETARTQTATMRDEAADYRAKALINYTGANAARVAAELAKDAAIAAAAEAVGAAASDLVYEPEAEKGPKTSVDGFGYKGFTYRWIEFSGEGDITDSINVGPGSVVCVSDSRFDDDGGLWRYRCAQRELLVPNPQIAAAYFAAYSALIMPGGTIIPVAFAVNSMVCKNGYIAIGTDAGVLIYRVDAGNKLLAHYASPDINDDNVKCVEMVFRKDSPVIDGRRFPDIWVGTQYGLNRLKAKPNCDGWTISSWQDTAGTPIEDVTHIARVRDKIYFSPVASRIFERDIDEVLADEDNSTRKAVYLNGGTASENQPYVCAFSNASAAIAAMAHEGIATDLGLVIVKHDSESPEKSLRLNMTSGFNTGFRLKSKGNWLCDNLLTTLTGGTVPLDRAPSVDNMTVTGAVTRSVNGDAQISYASIPDDSTNYLSGVGGAMTDAIATDDEWCLTFAIPSGLGSDVVINTAKASHDETGADLAAENGIIISLEGSSGSRVLKFQPYDAGALEGSALTIDMPDDDADFPDTVISVFQRDERIYLCRNGVITDAGPAQVIGAASSGLNLMVGNLQFVSVAEYAPTNQQLIYMHESILALMPSDSVLLSNLNLTILRYEDIEKCYFAYSATSNTLHKINADTGVIAESWDEAAHELEDIYDISSTPLFHNLVGSSGSKVLKSTHHSLDRFNDRAQRHTFSFDGDASATTFFLPLGYKPVNAWVGGSKKRHGAGQDYTIVCDGLQYGAKFSAAPGVTDVEIEGEVSIFNG